MPGDAAVPVDEGDELLLDGDRHLGEPETSSCLYESDLVHFKPCADVLLSAVCRPPGSRPVPYCNVELRVGGLSRRLRVTGDRHWGREYGIVPRPSHPQPFSEMPLVWERAFGGPRDKRNPVGIGRSRVEDETGRTRKPLPNVESPDEPVTSPLDRPEPVGTLPVGRYWRARAKKLTGFDDDWLEHHWPHLPPDFDWSFFNAAPPEQQLPGYLRGDEPLYFENLHRDHPSFHSALPGLRARAFVAEVGADPDGDALMREVPLHLDTLWIDLEAEQAVLVWRGVTQVATRDAEEIERLLIVHEPLADDPAPVESYRAALFGAADEIEVEEPDEPAAEPVEVDWSDPAVQDLVAQLPIPPERMSEIMEIEDRLELVRSILEASEIEPERIEQYASPDFERRLPDAETLTTRFGLSEDEAAELLDELQRPIPPTPPAAERVRAAVDAGESLAGHDLIEADLAGAALREADLSGALLLGANLADADLAGANLAGANLAGADLSRATLTGANLAEADLSEATLEQADCGDANLEGANLEQADAQGAVFERARAARVVLSNADLRGVRAREADLHEALLQECRLDGADFSGARLEGATLNGSTGGDLLLPGADLTDLRATDGCAFPGANLEGARGRGSQWEDATLSGANLAFAELAWANLKGADLSGANLASADLTRADLARAKLVEASLRGANLFESSLREADLSGADVRDANAYTAELRDAVTDGARFDGTNLKRTALEDWRPPR